ncbi:MAG TPA: FAD-dependent oxidoreductase [Steroidobacteraceae bacterium]
MRIIIVGAGVVGAATAYFVARRGHEVTLIDRHTEPACGTSFANAGQLSYSYTDTLADPSLWRRLPRMLLGRDSGMRILPDPALLPWGVRFLWNCTRSRSDRNTVRLLQLGAQSAFALEVLLRDLPIEFSYRHAGKLLLTSSPDTLRQLEHRARLKRAHGVHVEVVSEAECKAIEPALENWRGKIAGGSYSRDDHAGDARAFTRALCDRLISERICKLITGVSVDALAVHRGKVIGVRTKEGVMESDAVIVCAGIGSNALLRKSGLRVPIYPLKGYSVTAEPGPHPPKVSLTDLDRRIVFANLNGHVRLAGLADIVGADASVDPARVEQLVKLAQSVMPEAAQLDSPLETWAGLRPSTPSGLPIVGPTRQAGLYLNVGHGALGWTLACGTAQQLAQALPPGR